MHPPVTYPTTRTFPGRLSTMAHPPGGAELPAFLTALRTSGVDILVSALTLGEEELLDLTDERSSAESAGMEFRSLPIDDFGVPDRATVTPALTALVAELRGGANVVVHCRGGVGRSSLLAAGLLVLDGVEPDEAWRLISAARGRTVPETDEQREWIRFT
ncbi:Cyclin-dependent kinase inhibitor 3 (CDKN3) [Umezawaea tangerina]|uniref:Cyclin-dependent kinase inhibitor 3 (CDKN3) n=2 Tax=Umezawaea tangerina TaxID=84725 RepID=A0A2T0TJT7_9PSEU|nr:Cyclin-dependent kinase inhibitor 3 (CDKN3) [Umezawaea tangerina]